MRRRIKTYYLLIAVAAVVVVGGIESVLTRAHDDGVSLVTDQVVDHQLTATSQTAARIEQTLATLERELELLSLDPAIRDWNRAPARQLMRERFQYVEQFFVNDISRLDSRGIVRETLYSPELIGKDFSFRTYFQELKGGRGPGKAYEFITFHGVEKGEQGIIIARSVLLDDGTFDGVMVFVVKVQDLLRGVLPPLSESNRAWVLDGQGAILHHPDVPLGTRIIDQEGLDPSFRLFLAGADGTKAGTGRYRALDGVDTMGIRYPVSLGGETWTLVVETRREQITDMLGGFSGQQVLGVSLALLAIFASTFVIVFLLNKWDLALREKSSERERALEDLTRKEEKFRILVESSPS